LEHLRGSLFPPRLLAEAVHPQQPVGHPQVALVQLGVARDVLHFGQDLLSHFVQLHVTDPPREQPRRAAGHLSIPHIDTTAPSDRKGENREKEISCRGGRRAQGGATGAVAFRQLLSRREEGFATIPSRRRIRRNAAAFVSYAHCWACWPACPRPASTA